MVKPVRMSYCRNEIWTVGKLRKKYHILSLAQKCVLYFAILCTFSVLLIQVSTSVNFDYRSVKQSCATASRQGAGTNNVLLQTKNAGNCDWMLVTALWVYFFFYNKPSNSFIVGDRQLSMQWRERGEYQKFDSLCNGNMLHLQITSWRS